MVVGVLLHPILLPLPPLTLLLLLLLVLLILLTLCVFYSLNSPPTLLRGTNVHATADHRLRAPRASCVDGQQSVSSVTGARVSQQYTWYMPLGQLCMHCCCSVRSDKTASSEQKSIQTYNHSNTASGIATNFLVLG